MTIETIKKEWEDLEDIDLAEFVLKDRRRQYLYWTSRTTHQRSMCITRMVLCTHHQPK